MTKTRRKDTRNEILYKRKMTISSILWLLCGLCVLGFGIYFREIFELVGGGLLILFSLAQFSGKNRRIRPKTLVKREEGKLKFLSFSIAIFSLINPIGIIPALYDLFKRDWVMRGGLNEEKD